MEDAFELAKGRAKKAPEMEEAFKRAMIKTNIMYSLLMIASDFAVDINDELKCISCCVKQRERQEVSMLEKQIGTIKTRMAGLCSVMWKDAGDMEQVSIAEDVTKIKRLLITAVSKAGTDAKRFESIIRMVETRYKTLTELDPEHYVD